MDGPRISQASSTMAKNIGCTTRKKRIQTQRSLDAENVLDDAIKEMDEVIEFEQVRSEILLLCL